MTPPQPNFTAANIRTGAIRGLVAVAMMSAWEKLSFILSFPRPLDWTVNEWFVRAAADAAGLGAYRLVCGTPDLIRAIALILHFIVGVGCGVLFECGHPERFPRWAEAIAWSACLQLLLFAVAPLAGPVSPLLAVGTLVGHGFFAVALATARRT